MTTPTITSNGTGYSIEVEAYAHGGKAWLATVTKGGKFGMERDFGSKRDVTSAKSNKYRSLILSINASEGDQLEYASQESSSRQERDYYRIENGKLVSITAKEIA